MMRINFTQPQFGKIERKDVNRNNLLVDLSLKAIYEEGLAKQDACLIKAGKWHLYEPLVDSLEGLLSRQERGNTCYEVPARVYSPQGECQDYTARIYPTFTREGIDPDFDAVPKMSQPDERQGGPVSH